MLGLMVILAGIFGGWELLLIFAVVIILAGARHLPTIAKGLGEGMLEFRKALDQQAHDAGESLGGIYGKPAEALTPENQIAELYDPAVFNRPPKNRRVLKWKFFRWQRLWRAVWRLVVKCLKPKI